MSNPTKDLSCTTGAPHPSEAHKAGCPLCNPTKTVPELNREYAALTSNPLAQICSCTWLEGLREPGIDCPVHPRPTPGKERFRKVESNVPWRLIPCRLCGSPAELWQRWRRDDVWDSFGACTNLEDVDGEACLFHLPDDPHFYRDRKMDAMRHWNLIMGPRSAHETTPKHQGWCASINPDPCNCVIATKPAIDWCPHYDLPIVNQPGCPDCAYEKRSASPEEPAVRIPHYCTECGQPDGHHEWCSVKATPGQKP